MPMCNIEREKIVLHLLISIQEPQTKLAQNQPVCFKYECQLYPGGFTFARDDSKGSALFKLEQLSFIYSELLWIK